MEIKDIKEFNDEELNKKLEGINKQIEEALKNSNDRLNQKIKLSIKEFKKKMKKKKEQNLKNIRVVPFIQINQVEGLNYVINPTLLVLASLKVFKNFIYAEETKEILKRIYQMDNQNFIIYFNGLMISMRDDRNKNPDYQPIHLYFKQLNMEINYMSPDPAKWFNLILRLIKNNIDIVKANDLENIITKKFEFNLCKMEKCDTCEYSKKYPQKGQFLINLNLHSDEAYAEELNNVFNIFALGERKLSQSACPKCTLHLYEYILFDKTSKYLIINVKRQNDKMTLTLEENLKIYDDSEKNEYEYEITSSLTIINANYSIIFIHDFINNRWYKIVQGALSNIDKNIREEISKQNPNILIYKKISKK